MSNHTTVRGEAPKQATLAIALTQRRKVIVDKEKPKVASELDTKEDDD